MTRVFASLLMHEGLHQLTSLQILGGKKGKRILMGSAYFLVCAIIALYSGVGAYGLCYFGAGDAVIPVVSHVSMLLVLMIGLFKMAALLYESKDIEFLLSLPIPVWMIPVAKLSSSVVFSTLMVLLLLVPSAAVVAVMSGQLQVLVLSIFLSPVIALVPCVLSAVLSSVAVRISVHFQHRTNVKTVLMLMMILFLPSVLNLFSTVENITLQGVAVESSVALSPLAKLCDAALSGDLLSILAFVLMSFGISCAGIMLVAHGYLRIVSRCKSSVKKRYHLKPLKASAKMKTLVQREFVHYASSSLYMMNTAFGLVVALALVIAVCVMPLDELAILMEIELGVKDMMQIMPVLFAMVCAMCCTTASSLSLEGKSLWLLKSLPVTRKDIYVSKIMMNVLLNLPVVLLGGIVLMVRFSGSLLFKCFCVLFPLCFCVLGAVAGMLMNAWFQNYSWTNEAEVVKQGFASFLGMLFPLLLGALCIAVMLVVKTEAVLMLLCLGVAGLTLASGCILMKQPIKE